MINTSKGVEPVLEVVVEPDYWCRGHFYEGTKPYISESAIWKLPIGTKLYPASAFAAALAEVERLKKDAQELRDYALAMDKNHIEQQVEIVGEMRKMKVMLAEAQAENKRLREFTNPIAEVGTSKMQAHRDYKEFPRWRK